MSIYVVGSSKNKFLPLNDIRTKFLIDEPHDGANIDFLNPWYCELTGLYYMWRHCTDDIVGLEHYRRYFVNDDNTLLSNTDIKHCLSAHDIILRKYVFPKELPTAISHFSADKLPYLNRFIHRLDDDHRDYIVESLHTKPYFAQCNMFITTRPLLHEYCTWLFNQLVKLSFDDFVNSRRIIGYLAEFVFGYWLEYEQKIIYWCKSITI